MSGDEEAERQGFEQFERFLDAWSRRDFLKGLGATGAYFAFSAGVVEFLDACASTGTSTPQAGKKGGHVVEGAFSDVRTFNSMLSSDTASNQVLGLMFDGLLNSKKNGDLIGALAQDLPKTSSDGLTYTFKLRPNLKWSDGQPLTADDVVFTYQLAYDPQYKDFASPRRGDLSKYIATVVAPSAYSSIRSQPMTQAKNSPKVAATARRRTSVPEAPPTRKTFMNHRNAGLWRSLIETKRSAIAPVKIAAPS